MVNFMLDSFDKHTHNSIKKKRLSPLLRKIAEKRYSPNFFLDTISKEIYEQLKGLNGRLHPDQMTDNDVKLYKATIEEYNEDLRKSWQNHFCLFCVAYVPIELQTYYAANETNSEDAEIKCNIGYRCKEFICFDLKRFFQRITSKLFLPFLRKRKTETPNSVDSATSTETSLDDEKKTAHKKFQQESSPQDQIQEDCYMSCEDCQANITPGRALLNRIKSRPLKIPMVQPIINNTCKTCKAAKNKKKVRF